MRQTFIPVWFALKLQLYPVSQKNTGQFTLADNFEKCWPIFNFFTNGLCSKFVHISLHLKHVVILPCKTFVLQN